MNIPVHLPESVFWILKRYCQMLWIIVMVLFKIKNLFDGQSNKIQDIISLMIF